MTDAPAVLPASTLIVVKGLLDQGGMVGAVEGAGAESRLPREWMLVVSRVEGTIVRFVAGGVDLIEPGGTGGNTESTGSFKGAARCM